MNPRLVNALMHLYPARWRQRYAAEFSAFLRERKGSILDVLNVIWSAMREHMSYKAAPDMNRSEQASGRLALSSIAVLAGGINLVMTVDDSPLINVMQSNIGIGLAWKLFAGAAVVLAIGVLPTIFHLYRSMLLYARKAHRRDIALLLGVPLMGAAVLSLWGVSGLAYTNGSWVASPWAILDGDSTLPSWPSLHARWICGIISVVLSIAVGAATAISVQSAIRRSGFGWAKTGKQGKARSLANLSMLLVTACTLVTLLSVLAWGLAVQQSAPGLLQQTSGLLNGTAATSWGISLDLFGWATVICIRANRITFASTN